MRFIERSGEIVIQPITSEFIRSVCGVLKNDKSITLELPKDRAKDRQREERKFEKFPSQ